jgi:microcystin-dependent protein
MYYNGSSGSQKSIEYPAGSIVAHCVSLVKDPPGWIICDGNSRTVSSNSNRYDQLLSLGIGTKGDVYTYDGEVTEIDINGTDYQSTQQVDISGNLYLTGQVFDYTPPDLSNMLLKGYGGTTTDAIGNLVKDTNSSNTVTITSDNIPSHNHTASYSDSHNHSISPLSDSHNHSGDKIKIKSHNHSYSNKFRHQHGIDHALPSHQHTVYVYGNDWNWKGGNAPTLRLYGDTNVDNTNSKWLLCTYTTTTVNQYGVDSGGPEGFNWHSDDESGTNLGYQNDGQVYGPEPDDENGSYPYHFGHWKNVKGTTDSVTTTIKQDVDSNTMSVAINSSSEVSQQSTSSSESGMTGTGTTSATYSSSGTETTTTETTIDILPSSFKVYWLMKL